MKENIGISALIVAALAFLVHSGGPGPPPARGKNAQAQTATTTADIEGPWLATRAFFHSPDQPMPRAMASVASVLNCVRSAGMCRGPITTYFGIPSVNRVQFLVATVPDPLHSRVSLLTDSAIQAIQEGADASDWIFANQWLPWIDEANPEETDPDKRRSERKAVREQEKQPGILVFRRARPRSGPYSGAPFSDEVLMVFLVGETPTAGVNPAQFELARAYMRSIHGPEDEVRILGPTFSGSFYSLADLLVDDEKYHPVKTYRVRSGTVTGARDAASFRDSFGLFARDRYALDFRSATASTDDQDCYFNKALDDLGIKAERAASLIEDESAFGNAAALTSVKGRSCWGVGGPIEAQPIRVYRFPRDISHLRNSYRDAVTAAKAGNGAAPDIEFSIKDPEKGEDSIPIFSGSQTPLSQYGIVNRIAAAIRGDDVRLVQISATNTLDMLFLAGFLRRQCPDTRLILNYPDVLLVQAAQSEPLTGTLILASYPGFAAANGWMGSQQTMRPLIFSDGNSEGVYNATVLLLTDEPELPFTLADYRWRGLPHPPSWLLTLDHRGFLPVDVFRHDPMNEDKESWFQQVPEGAKGGLIKLPPVPRAWRIATAVIAFLCLSLCAWIGWISTHALCEMDARFSFQPLTAAEGNWRRFHISALLSILLLMEATIGIPGLQHGRATGFLVLSGLSIGAILAGIVIMVWHMMPDRGTKLALGLTFAASIAFLALWGVACLTPGDRSFFFAFRARELRFGSSPALPLVAALGALGLFVFVHLTRFYLDGCQNPGALTEGLGTALQARMEEAYQDFTRALKSMCCFQLRDRNNTLRGPVFLAGAVLAAGVIGSYLFEVQKEMRSIDGSSYNWLAISLQILIVVLLLVTCASIRSLWGSLQDFLAAIATLPLAKAFTPIDESGADRPLWVRRLNLESIDLHIRALYELHNMDVVAKELKDFEPWWPERVVWIKGGSDAYAEKVKALLEVDPKRSRDKTFERTMEIRKESQAMAKGLMLFLHDFWRTRPLLSPGSADGAPAAPDTLERFGRLAERSVALHYSSFVLYGVRQIQNLLIFLSTGFVLLMISLNCYSVQAPRFAGHMLILLFAVTGASVVSCLVGIERNPILSRIAGSKPGQLNTKFYWNIVAYGTLPGLSLLASEFPSISNFLLSWVEPTLEAFK
jgi:hypothetical protein